MVFETVLQADLSKPVQVKQLPGHFFSSDNNANKITVEVFNKGVPVTPLDGVTAYIIRDDDVTVPCTENNGCGHSDNKAWVVLPSAAYAVPGQTSVVIKCGSTTICAVTTYVYKTTTNAIVDPSHVIPDIEELLEKISDCEAATQNANTATLAAISATADAEAAAGSVNSAILAAQSATARANSATTAATSATSAANTATLAATSATAGANTATQSANTATLAATSATAGANTATLAAVSATAGANSATQAAQSATAGVNTAIDAANSVADYLGGMTVVASTVSPDTPASATLSTESGHAKISFEIPRGESGNETIDDTKGYGDTDYVWSADKDSKELDKKAPVIEQVIDTPASVVSFSDGADNLPMEVTVGIDASQDLHGYEYPWIGGAGKNIFNASDVDDEHNYYVNSANGQNATPKTGEWRATGYVPVTAGETYYIGKINGSGSSVGLAYYDSSKTYVSGISENSLENANNIITIPSDCSYMRFSIRIDEGYNTNWENTVYVVKNSDTHEWTPYSNICPISGWDDLTIFSKGRNLVPPRYEVVQGHYLTNTGSVNEGSSYLYIADYIPVKPNTVYNFQYYKNTTTSGAQRLCLYNANKECIDAVTTNNGGTTGGVKAGTFTTTSETYYVRIGCLKTQTYNYQLTEGAETISYEQINKEYNVTFPDPPGTVYGGTMTVNKDGTGSLVVDKVCYTCTSSDTFDTTSQTGVYHLDGILVGHKKEEQVWSNRYKQEAASGTSTMNDFTIRANGNGGPNTTVHLNVYVKDTHYENVEAFNADVAGLQLLYNLATPVTYQLSAPIIRSLLGTNNIWADTGDILSVDYSADTKSYIDQTNEEQNNAITDINGMIADGEASMVATKNYSIGDLFTVQNKLLKATSAIASGEEMVTGTGGNCEETTVANEISAILNSSATGVSF